MGFSAKQVQALRRSLNQPARSHAPGQWTRALLYRRLVCDLGSQSDLWLRWLEPGDRGIPLRPRARKPRDHSSPSISPKCGSRCRPTGATIIREGHGSGEGRGTSPGEVHDIALKAAETDATKRALATFGKPFGLELYRKDKKASLKSLPALQPATASPPIQPRLGLHPDDTTPIPRPSHYYGRRHQNSMTELLRRDQEKAKENAATAAPLAPAAANWLRPKSTRANSRSPNPNACATRHT